MFKRIRKLSGDFGIRARLLYYTIGSKVRRVNKFLDENDLEEEFTKRLKRHAKRRASCPVLGNSGNRRRSDQIKQAQPMGHRSRRASMFDRGRPGLEGDDKTAFPPYKNARRRITGQQSMIPNQSLGKILDRRYSAPIRIGRSLSEISTVTSGYDSCESSTCLEPIHSLDTHEEVEVEDKEGKLFLSAEYSSDDKLLFVFVTQCGSVSSVGGVGKLRLSFSRVVDGAVSKKTHRKLEKPRSRVDFRKTYTYTLSFGSYEKMAASGVLVRIKLKSMGTLNRKTLKTVDLALNHVTKDPAWRTEEVFF